tara:strand:- start:3170 stop:4225 length:1056 start_codon:yes stop_codon:yes gene_type:complete
MGKILWIRPDSIGDAVLSASMLRPLSAKFNKSKIHVVCQHNLRSFYEASPYVDKVIDFEEERLINSQSYREKLIEQITKNNYKLSLNSVRSPTDITDFFQEHNGAAYRTDFNSSVGRFSTPRLELESHKDFIKSLGCASGPLTPTLWIPHVCVLFAEKLFKDHNLDPSRTVVLAPGVQKSPHWNVSPWGPVLRSPRIYNHYCRALESLCEEEDLTVVVVGTEKDRPTVNANLKNFKGKVVDIVGKTSILQMAAIIKKSRLLVGGDSAAAHIACAVETPNAIVLGGGHYRRFFPYSKWTYCAVLYLDCFGCDWDCKHPRPYCIQNVSPLTLEAAVRNAWSLKGEQITFQKSL